MPELLYLRGSVVGHYATTRSARRGRSRWRPVGVCGAGGRTRTYNSGGFRPRASAVPPRPRLGGVEIDRGKDFLELQFQLVQHC